MSAWFPKFCAVSPDPANADRWSPAMADRIDLTTGSQWFTRPQPHLCFRFWIYLQAGQVLLGVQTAAVANGTPLRLSVAAGDLDNGAA